MDQNRVNRLDWVLVALLTAVGLGLRLAYLLQVPPFLDEYSSMLTGLSILRTGGIPRLPSGVIYPSGSLFSYLEAAFIGLFGFGDAVARLPSLLVSVLTLPALYLVARAMLNRRVALLSVALLAMAPEAIVWGGRARMYALLQLLVLLAAYFFYRSVLAPTPGRDTHQGSQVASQAAPPAWPWVLCFIAAIFTQDEAILLLPLFWLAALVARGPRWFLRPGVLLGQVLLPAAAVGVRYWLNEIRVPGEVFTLTHDAFFRFPPDLAHGLQRIAPFFTAPWAWPLALLFLVALFFAIKQQYDLLSVKSASQQPTTNNQAGQRGRTLFPITAPIFLAYTVLAIAAALILVVNTPWQNARYLFMVLPLFLMVSTWGLDRVLELLSRRWPALQSRWVTIALVTVVGLLALPAGLSALKRFEPDYSAAYRWLAPQLNDEDLVATMRPAPAAVYLGRADLLVAEDKHQEFIMRLDGLWVDRWAGASVLESPEAFRDEALQSGQRVWFVIDEDRFESAAYSPEFVALVLSQMDLVWHEGGVLVFRGQGYQPPPDMAVTRDLDANFGDQLRLTGYALSSVHPQPGQEVTLHLYWQAIHPERYYTVFVHITGADGQGLTQVDGVPYLGLYDMTTHWPRDRAVVDERRLTIPTDTPPGHYRLQVGLYDPDDPDAGPLPLATTGETSLTLDFLSVNLPTPPEPSQPVAQGNLGNMVRLVGYDLLQTEAATSASLPLTLTWECLATMDADYTVFVHLVDGDNQPLAQDDGQPLGGAYPTNFWSVGERVVDPRLLTMPGDVPPGEYELLAGMYLLATGDRLPLLDQNSQVLGDSISLGHIIVTAP